MLAGPMGIRNTKRKNNNNNNNKNVQNCHVNSLARMESACVLREGLMSSIPIGPASILCIFSNIIYSLHTLYFFTS